MSLSSLVGKLAAPLAVVTALSTTPRPAEADDFNLSVRLGHQIPSEQLTQDFSSGFAIGGEANWFPASILSVDLGASLYNSPGDFLSYSSRRFFTKTSGRHSEFSDEISFNEGITLYRKGNEVIPFIGAGLKQSIFEDNDVSGESGYRDSYSRTDVDVRDVATGNYFRFGFIVPFDYKAAKDTTSRASRILETSNSFFVEFELRNLSKQFEDFKREYNGYTLSLGLKF